MAVEIEEMETMDGARRPGGPSCARRSRRVVAPHGPRRATRADRRRVASPTAAGIVAPDTGSGGYADRDNAGYGVLMLALAAFGAVGAGVALALRRR
jgi:hypothetical protein